MVVGRRQDLKHPPAARAQTSFAVQSCGCLQPLVLLLDRTVNARSSLPLRIAEPPPFRCNTRNAFAVVLAASQPVEDVRFVQDCGLAGVEKGAVRACLYFCDSFERVDLAAQEPGGVDEGFFGRTI